MDENCLLYDWFACTLPCHGDFYNKYCQDVDTIFDGSVFIELLGLQNVSFQVGHGVRGYSRRLWFEGINIHLPGSDEKTEFCWLEMSGSGCRTFETVGHGNWDLLFKFALEYCHITRLDVSFDDHSGILDMPTLFDDTFKHRHFVTKSFCHKLVYELNERSASEAYTIYHGSDQSEVKIRIYDKAAQLHRVDEHWIRVEMELHRDRASDFLRLQEPLGKAWCGVLLNYLRYVEPTSDSNKWRWPLKKYWFDLVGAVEPLHLPAHKTVEYNLDKLHNFVFYTSGNAIRTAIQLSGVDNFLQGLIDQAPKELPDKYAALLPGLEDHNATSCIRDYLRLQNPYDAIQELLAEDREGKYSA